MRREGPVGEAGSQSKYPATSTSSTQPLTASPAPCPPDDSKHLRRYPTLFLLETKVGPVLPTNSSHPSPQTRAKTFAGILGSVIGVRNQNREGGHSI